MKGSIMEYETVTRKGKRFVLVEESEFRRLKPRVVANAKLPPFPPKDKDGNSPAIEFMRISLAREIISMRTAVGLTQAELARQSGVRVETLNRLEKGRHTPDEKTFAKIEKAIRKAGTAAAKPKAAMA
jgi:DNA-binding XRE family transcriptional regulator